MVHTAPDADPFSIHPATTKRRPDTRRPCAQGEIMFGANTYKLRLATEDDADALRRLAELDSRAPLAGRVLIGELAGSRPPPCRSATTASSPTRSAAPTTSSPACASGPARSGRTRPPRRSARECAQRSSPARHQTGRARRAAAPAAAAHISPGSRRHRCPLAPNRDCAGPTSPAARGSRRAGPRRAEQDGRAALSDVRRCRAVAGRRSVSCGAPWS